MTSGMVRVANHVRKMLRNNWDWWTVFDGPEGVGKSTDAIWFCHYVSGRKFKIDEHICHDALEFLEMIDTAPRYGSILIDEAAELWYNRDFASRTNKALAKASTQVRDRNLNIVMCLPTIHMLDKAGMRRHKTYVQVSAPGGIRGKSEWYKPIWRRYESPNVPYWDLKFVDYFPQLPIHIEEQYARVKLQQSRARMDDYREVVEDAPKEKEQFDAYAIAREILAAADQSKYLGARGHYTIHAIQAATQLSQGRAYMVYNAVRQLTDEE